jgi:hypothetical protein
MTDLQKEQSTPLFLLGSGRSGTTLIQRLLNSYDDTMIWGEHHGFLSKIAESYFLLKDSPSMEEFTYHHQPNLAHEKLTSHYKNPAIWQAWINWFRPDDLANIYRSIVENFFNHNSLGEFKYWGFKEIRYGSSPLVIEFLSEIYPQGRFILITRHGLNTIESQLTSFHRGNSRFIKVKRILQIPLIIKLAHKWARDNKYYAQLITTRKAKIVHINYDLIQEDNYLSDKFTEIGKPFTEIQEKIMRSSAGRGSGMKDDSSENSRWKRMGYLPSVIASLFINSVNLKISEK